jgi:CBS domain-containing protein
MTVAKILAEKGRTVVTIQPQRSLGEAAKLLAEKRIGALIVGDASNAVAGIVSERDIVRAVASAGAAALEHPIARHMTAKVVSCTSEAHIDEITRLMTEGRFRHLPVMDGGRLVGVVSIGDVVKQRIAEVEAEGEAMRSYIATA